MLALVHGFILALGLILPLGVQNVFIFNQGAVQPRVMRAMPAVLTATSCDALLILLAVAGVSVVVLSVSWLRYALFIVGVLFLLYMGWVTWRSPEDSPEKLQERAALSPKQQVVFSTSVSLLNPHAIMDTVGGDRGQFPAIRRRRENDLYRRLYPGLFFVVCFLGRSRQDVEKNKTGNHPGIEQGVGPIYLGECGVYGGSVFGVTKCVAN